MIAISPHLDDAAFSAFATLSEAESVHVITVCAGIPPESTSPTAYDRLTGAGVPAARYRQRVAEDDAAMRAQGWTSERLTYLDSPYRHGKRSLPDVVVDVGNLVVDIPRATVLVPAGIGQHPDHLMVRDAALLALRESDHELRLYADLPYASRYGWPGWVSGVAADPHLDVDAFYAEALGTLSRVFELGEPEVMELDSGMQERKLALMRIYASQFPAMEAGPSRNLTHPERIRHEVWWPVRRR